MRYGACWRSALAFIGDGDARRRPFMVAVMRWSDARRRTAVQLVYAETLSNGNTSTSYYQHGCNTTELVGLLEIGKVQVIEFTTHRD
jgi:hypothetical protein